MTLPVATQRWTRLAELLALLALCAAALLAGCASAPRAGRDGAESSPPSDLARVPDAEPKLETIRSGGPNKPYEVLGQNYVPITQDRPFTERGLASWYGRKFHGRRTASGEVYNMYAMTAAHPTLPIPSYARIRNPANGREVVVRINDRGPFHAGRIVDLSYTAALKLELLRGVAPVELMRITFDDIRTGAWRRDTSDAPVRVAAAPDAARDAGDGNNGGNGGGNGGGNSAPGRSVAAPASVAVPAASVVAVASSAAPEASAASSVALDAPLAASSPSAAPAPVADAPIARAYTTPARGFWVQLGAFRERGGAESFQGRVASELDWLSPLLAVFSDAAMYKLQAGPYPSRDEARAAAERVRSALQLVPVIVERR